MCSRNIDVGHSSYRIVHGSAMFISLYVYKLVLNKTFFLNAGELKLTEVSLMRLILELTTILNNPDSDCTVSDNILNLLTRGRFHKAIKFITRQIVSITIVFCVVTSHFTSTSQSTTIDLQLRSLVFVKSGPCRVQLSIEDELSIEKIMFKSTHHLISPQKTIYSCQILLLKCSI